MSASEGKAAVSLISHRDSVLGGNTGTVTVADLASYLCTTGKQTKWALVVQQNAVHRASAIFSYEGPDRTDLTLASLLVSVTTTPATVAAGEQRWTTGK